MKFSFCSTLLLTSSLAGLAPAANGAAEDRVKIQNGILQGSTNAQTGVRAFKGIPFGQPPVGELRWKAPQAVQNWTGVREAMTFGPRCMQGSIFGDMNFRSNGMGEDCLYLNVWTPANS